MMKIQLLDKLEHKGKEYLGGDIIEVSNVDGKKLVKENKARLISATKKKRVFKKMKAGEIVEEKKIEVAFMFEFFDLDDYEDLKELSFAKMTFEAFYKTFVAIIKMCKREQYSLLQIVFKDEVRVSNNIYNPIKDYDTLLSIAQKKDLHKFFETL